jgi:patatin-like phospholipase/acyl hydrolase
MSRPVTVLALDGGGIRGIIPALILAEIERRTKKPISALFDLIAGTSTGGILALGLSLPGPNGKPAHTASSLISFYDEEGPSIFSRSVWHRVHAVGDAFEEKYPVLHLESVLEYYFGEAKLSSALNELLISSYEIERRLPWFFKRHAAREKGGDYDLPMKLIARATSAAPTYFAPVRIKTMNGPDDYYALIDGGVYANNPAMCAYVEARCLYRDRDDFLVVSLGTGGLTRRLPCSDAEGWGLLGWARPILGVVFDGVSGTVDYQLRQLLPEIEKNPRYFRFQVRLDEGNDDMDDASRTNLRVLHLIGEQLIKDNDAALDNLCTQLVSN